MNNSPALPQGFRAAGVYCGIKSAGDRSDLTLFAADAPCTAAGVFTQNRVCGAPVKVSRQRVPSEAIRAVIINSGNANACTGERGFEDAEWMTAAVAGELDCDAENVLVCSTGVIGHFLHREKLEAGIPKVAAALAADADSFAAAARGMMTTDTFSKQAMREVEIDGIPIRVSGASKGAAMIAPNMATMLAVVMTDAALSSSAADAMLRHAVNRSFNCISVEGHTSTSDSVILLASGQAGSGTAARRVNSDANDDLQRAIDEVCEDLAMQIIRDAEGAGHFITIDVRGLRTRAEALRIAKIVAEGPLVKTAIAGADPNWGRIVSAVGYAGVDLCEEDISLRMNGVLIYRAGNCVPFDAAALSEMLRSNRDVHLEIDVTLGDAAVRFWTCDLTTEYVRLNSEYTT